MRVSELEGALLDYWVAKAEGLDAEIDGEYVMVVSGYCAGGTVRHSVQYSTNWADGGPIIERERIGLYCWGGGCAACVRGVPNYSVNLEGDGHESDGPTPLIAAMRAYVGLRFGAEVPDDVL